MLPDSIVLLTVALSPVLTRVPVEVGKVRVGVPADDDACNVAVPLEEPGNATLLIPVSAKFALERLIATDVVPIYIV
jgi:hypothetical protein